MTRSKCDGVECRCCFVLSNVGMPGRIGSGVSGADDSWFIQNRKLNLRYKETSATASLIINDVQTFLQNIKLMLVDILICVVLVFTVNLHLHRLYNLYKTSSSTNQHISLRFSLRLMQSQWLYPDDHKKPAFHNILLWFLFRAAASSHAAWIELEICSLCWGDICLLFRLRDHSGEDVSGKMSNIGFKNHFQHTREICVWGQRGTVYNYHCPGLLPVCCQLHLCSHHVLRIPNQGLIDLKNNETRQI